MRVIVVPAVVALDGADEGGPSDEGEDGADTVDNGGDHAVLENAGALAESDAERPDDASNAEEESEDSESDSDAATVLWEGISGLRNSANSSRKRTHALALVVVAAVVGRAAVGTGTEVAAASGAKLEVTILEPATLGGLGRVSAAAKTRAGDARQCR